MVSGGMEVNWFAYIRLILEAEFGDELLAERSQRRALQSLMICGSGLGGSGIKEYKMFFSFYLLPCVMSVFLLKEPLNKSIYAWIFRSVSLKSQKVVLFYSLHSFLIGMYLTDLTYINTLHPFTGGLDTERTIKVWFAWFVYGHF